MLTAAIGFVVLLGGLIFFHELGHYSIAKLFNVKVEVFSLGFGKKIFRRIWGETEYCISLVPLGGYVKLMGDDPYKEVPAAEVHRAFSTQKLYKRFLIVAAGPVANFLLAFVLLTAVLFIGKPLPGTRIGNVVINSPAWEAGLRPRDKILEIASQPMHNWLDVNEYLRDKDGTRVDFRIQRGPTELKLPVTVTKIRSKNAFGEDEWVGGIKGISLSPLEAMIGVSNSESVAHQAGLRTGDVIAKVDGQTITLFEELQDVLAEKWGRVPSITLQVKRQTGAAETDVTEQTLVLAFPKGAASKLQGFGVAGALGIYSTDVFVKSVNAGSPAEKGGLKPGDRIISVSGTPIYNFEAVVEMVQQAGKENRPIVFKVEREGKLVELELKPEVTTHEDPLTRMPVSNYMVGFVRQTSLGMPETVHLQIHHPIELLKRSAKETGSMVRLMVISIAKLVVGSISLKNLGGPLLIASEAGKSLDEGIAQFLQVMAMISMNLFLINLFPIPILDGGHLFFFTIEALRGRPVSIRAMEIANQIGMVVILMLVGLTFFNDISRMILR